MIELLRRFGGKFRRYMVIGPACKLIEVIFDLLTPLVIAQMIDKGIGAHDVSAVVHYGMVLAAMAVIGISFTLVCETAAPVGELVSAAIAATGAIPATSAAERAMPTVARLALLARMSFISAPHFKGRRLTW